MRRLTTQDFISKAVELHGDKYDYRFVDYTNNKTKVKIGCPDHGFFYQAPSNHTRWGCYSCRMKTQLGDKRNEPSNLYYIKFKYEGNWVYKIGITNLDVATRYKNQKYQDFKILAVVPYKKGEDAFDREQRLLNEFVEYRKAVPKEIYKDGWTETLSINVFGTEDKDELIKKLKG